MSTAETPFVVQCRGIAKRYGRCPVLQGFDLDVARGEVFGLVGANGGSKTTILRIIAGLLRPDSGTCTLFGRRPAETRPRVGYMVQGQGLYGHLTVAENLRARALLFDLPDATRAVADALSRFMLAPFADTPVADLSGGWARRAQFVAALIHDPDLLLLDEPTVGLDAVARQIVWRHIVSLADGGTTIVVSTHDLAEAERFSRLVFLVKGVARAQGTVGDIVDQSDARSFLLRGPDAGRCVADALVMPGIVAAYPSVGAIRVITRSATAAEAQVLAWKYGLEVSHDRVSLDDAAQSLLHGVGA